MSTINKTMELEVTSLSNCKMAAKTVSANRVITKAPPNKQKSGKATKLGSFSARRKRAKC